MPQFDVRSPQWATIRYAEEQIQDAWLAQFAGTGILSRLLIAGSQGVHSHSAMCRRNKNGTDTIDILEVREFYGGRVRPIEAYLDTPGRIDFFSPNAVIPVAGSPSDSVFKPRGAVSVMRHLTASRYGYWGVLGVMLRRVPLLWHLFPVITHDVIPHEKDPEPSTAVPPFCSHAVAMAYQYGGGVDVVPRKPNFLVTPSDLTFSMFFSYEFSLATPYTRKHYQIDQSNCLGV